MENKIVKIKSLIKELKGYSDEYYNNASPSVSDAVYDRLFDELVSLEKETNIIFNDSPTQKVGAQIVGELTKVSHPIPLLSLDKTKMITDVISFKENRDVLLMLKLDGLTTKLVYENGELIEGSTRGNGEEGENITHNVKVFKNVPLQIPHKERLVITGESYIDYNDFNIMQQNIVDSSGNPYKNPRNLASGSVRQLDSSTCAKRNVRFQAFTLLEGMDELVKKTNSKNSLLEELSSLGFDVCKYTLIKNKDNINIEEKIFEFKDYATNNGIPIDGVVISQDDIAYSKSLGRTSHHYKDGIAFKFEDELHETVLESVEWTPSRSGEIAPVAIFKTIEIEGSNVSRASLHNVSFIKDLELNIGNRILVSKRNMIIPHIEVNLDKGGTILEFPDVCPSCGCKTEIKESTASDTLTLFCNNTKCNSQWIGKLKHFVAKKAFDIDGLSEQTLVKFDEKGWLKSYADIFKLSEHKDEIVTMEGFGVRSYEKIISSIEESRNTTFSKFLIGLDIPMVGRSNSKLLAEVYNHDILKFREAVEQGYDFSTIDSLGDIINENIHTWFKDSDNIQTFEDMFELVTFEKVEAVVVSQDNEFNNKVVVVTGTLQNFTRDSINEKLVSLGARAGSSVSKSTDYVIYGEKAGSKLSKAQSLGVKTLSEQEFLDLIK
ncbi:MAG: NAD-dependent DNA ligase LigA [bacterium]